VVVAFGRTDADYGVSKRRNSTTSLYLCSVTLVTPAAISSERWQESFGKGSASCTSATRNERSISSSDLLLLH
jgi:hypothetical protein